MASDESPSRAQQRFKVAVVAACILVSAPVLLYSYWALARFGHGGDAAAAIRRFQVWSAVAGLLSTLSVFAAVFFCWTMVGRPAERPERRAACLRAAGGVGIAAAVMIGAHLWISERADTGAYAEDLQSLANSGWLGVIPLVMYAVLTAIIAGHRARTLPTATARLR